MKKDKVERKSTGGEITPKRRLYYDRYSKKESRDLTKILAIQYAQQAGPYRAALLKCIAEDDFPALLAFDYSYSDFTPLSVRQLAALRQCLALYSKDDELTLPGVDKKLNCLNGLVKTELKCRETNQRLYVYVRREIYLSRAPIIDKVARKISEILGECPKVEDLGFSFGPGSTTNVSKKYASPLNKLNAEMECSPHLVKSAIGRSYLNSMHQIKNHLVNKKTWLFGCLAVLGMVPKNALTFRTTVTEPGLNMPAQLELGKAIRRALRRYGLDLKYGQERNQYLAQLGSINNEEATVDIENASNTVAIMAVYLALYHSKDWFDMLDAFRSPTISVESEPYCLEMFSSMGNGFTFELETLIFYAISLVTCEDLGLNCENVSVYGDDIIIPSEAYTSLVENLSFYGFAVNDKKSFCSGPFRESCGKDYFFGTNIRPFYKKDQWTDARLVRLLNHDAENMVLLPRSFRSWLIRGMKSAIFFGPPGFGDGHVVASYYEEHAKVHYQRIHRTERQRFRHGDKPGYSFLTYTKYPMSSLPRKTQNNPKKKRALKLSNILFPLYDIYNKPKHRFIYRKFHYYYLSDAVVLAEDGNFINCINNAVKAEKSKLMQPKYSTDDVECDTLEQDPYVLSGGWRSRESAIYTLNLPALQGPFDYDPILD